MHPTTSAFLDLARLLAAVIVFIGHASGAKWTGGFLWQFGPLMDTCVMVFFVLSGYVIAYVVHSRDDTWKRYATNRAARLWSVAIPALVLTFTVDWFGVRIAPDLYLNQPWYHGDQPALRYIASLLMVHEYWNANLVPGINGPFWSLSYEAAYYLWAGILIFCKGHWKWPILLICIGLAGPRIAILFPIWLLGFAAFHWNRKHPLPFRGATVSAVIGFAALIFVPIADPASWPILTWLSTETITRYAGGIAFTLLLLGVAGISSTLPELSGTWVRRISWAAAPTFALYLLHRPLIQLFSYIGPEDPSSWVRRLLVIAGTAMCVLALSPLCDLFKTWLQRLGSRPN